jgi:CRISPR-associated protein Cmr4
MQTKTLYLFTRTPLHVGAGSSVGAIDQPIQRERHSQHPIIPGSSIKGVLRHAATAMAQLGSERINDMFGPETAGHNAAEARSGDLSFGEARPLAFPVRSAKGAFAYITCPLALQRLARDNGLQIPPVQDLPDQSCAAGSKVTLNGNAVVLEEYAFKVEKPFPAEWETALLDLVPDPVWKEAKDRLVLLSDEDFSHFVSTTTEISQHIKIDPRTGTVATGAFFNLESVPAETLFFAPIHSIGRPEDAGRGRYATDCFAELQTLLGRHPVLQFGGNSTTGRGFCSVTLA